MEIYSWAYLLGGDEFVVDFGGVTGIPPPAAKRPSGTLAKIKKEERLGKGKTVSNAQLSKEYWIFVVLNRKT